MYPCSCSDNLFIIILQFLEPISFDLLSCITLPLAEVLWQAANTCLVFVPLLTMGSIPVSAALALECQTALKDG